MPHNHRPRHRAVPVTDRSATTRRLMGAAAALPAVSSALAQAPTAAADVATAETRLEQVRKSGSAVEVARAENALADAQMRQTTAAARVTRAESDLASVREGGKATEGTGAVAAVQLADLQHGPALALKVREFGLATRAVGAGGVQISPAFVMPDSEVVEMAQALRSGLDALAAS